MNSDTPEIFTAEEKQLVKKEAPKTENRGRWTPPLLELAARKKLFDLLVPEVYGGRQLPLPQALHWLESASRLDGSFGWTLTLGAGAGIFGAFMDSGFAEEVFRNDHAFISGSGFPGGKAVKKGKGSYRVSGRWKYASGYDHATLVTANCHIFRNGNPLFTDGEPRVKAMAFYPNEVTKTSDWNSYGLKGTGSHNFTVQNVTIPPSRTFELKPESAVIPGTLYRYPFEAFASCTLAVSLAGMGSHFLSEAGDILMKRNNADSLEALPSPLKENVSRAKKQYKEARNALYRVVEKSWNTLEDSGELDDRLTARVSGTSRRSCRIILNSAQRMYPFIGMAAVQPENTINRVWRDLHTASQHMLLAPGCSSK